jgi:cystathionine beta-synthase
MQSYGFADITGQQTVTDVISRKTGALPDLVHVHPVDTIRDAIHIMTEYDVSQVPVLTAEPPVVMGEVAGAIDEESLLDLVFTGRAQLTDAVGSVIGAPFPLIGTGESVAAARQALTQAPALLVTQDGKPVSVLTRHDLLAFLGEGGR